MPLSHLNTCFCFLSLMMPLSVHALSTDQQQPMYIEADRASFDNQQGVTIYTGNVDIKQGSMKLKADKVIVSYTNDKDIQRIIAEMQTSTSQKRVYFRQLLDNQEELQAHAIRMEYDGLADVLHLKKQAEVYKNKDIFSGEYIVYDVKNGHITAESTEQARVSVVIQPKTTKSNPNPKPVTKTE